MGQRLLSVVLCLLFLAERIISSASNFENSTKSLLKRKRKDFDDSFTSDLEDCKAQRRQVETSQSFDLEEFEEALECCNFEEFCSIFKTAAEGKPENVDQLLSVVLDFGKIDWILWLYQNHFNIKYECSMQEKRILNLALRAKCIPLIEFMLENVENPFEHYTGVFFDSESRNILRNLKKPVRTALPIPKDKLKEFRKRFFRNYNRNEIYKIETSRQSVFLNTYSAAISNEFYWFNGLLRSFIIFEDEIGVDNGGLTNKWIKLLIESILTEDESRIFDPFTVKLAQTSSQTSNLFAVKDFSEPFFLENSKGIYLPNTKYSLKDFEFIGTVFGLAFCFDIPFGIEFLPAFYRILVGEIAYEGNDLELLEEEYYKSFEAIRRGNLEMVDSLNLEIDGVPVTRENFELLFAKKSEFLCFGRFKEHLEALKRGFLGIVKEGDWIQLELTSVELKNVFKGSFKLSAAEFKNHVNMSWMLDEASKSWILEIITEITDEERILLFKFITERSAVPFGGLKGLLTPISFASVYAHLDHLPTASTCGSIMKIPVYESKAILKEKLIYAIRNCETFDLE